MISSPICRLNTHLLALLSTLNCALTDLTFSYDADENTAANTASATAPPQPVSTEPEVKAENGPGYGEEPDTIYAPAQFEDENIQDYSTHGNTMDFSVKEERDTGGDVHMHREPYSANIKEDG